MRLIRGITAKALNFIAALFISLMFGSVACERNGGEKPNSVERVKPPKIDDSSASKPENTLPDPRLEERSFPLLIWATYLVDREYFDKSRFDYRAQLSEALNALGAHTPEFFGELDGDEVQVAVGAKEFSYSLGSDQNDLKLADMLERILIDTRDALVLVNEELHELEYAAINGWLSYLDPHTILLTPKEHNELGVKTRGHFAGIGAEIRAEKRRIRVVRVLPETPAEAAGLKNQDLIVQIDGRSTVNMSSVDAQSLLRGIEGTKVKVKVQREKALHDIVITRGIIRIPALRSKLFPGQIGYIQLFTFQEDSSQRIEQELRKFAEKQPLAGLVLDLRGNTGGLLTQANAIVDQFVDQGELVSIHSAAGREAEIAKDKMSIAKEIPIVVLISSSSASAAEIVSGSLQQLDRAVVLGRTSFGKGTVQRLRPASPYGRELALKMTIAEYRVAGDQRIQSIGVNPELQLFPVHLSHIEAVGRLYDEEIFEMSRERSRTKHLPSARHDQEWKKVVSTLHQLKLRYSDLPDSDVEAPSKKRIKSKKNASGQKTKENPELDELRDPEVRIAHVVAQKLAGASNHPSRLNRLKELRVELSAKEDKKIVDGIAKWGIDWSGTPDRHIVAKLVVKAKIVGKKSDKLPRVGEVFDIEVSIQNTEQAAVERVHVITRSLLEELDGIELAFGKIEAGAVSTQRLKVQVYPWRPHVVETLDFDAHAGEPDPQADGHASLKLEVLSVPVPKLAYNYWIIDDPKLSRGAPKRPKTPVLPGEAPFSISGNGDGMLQPGERVLIAFLVGNQGEGVGEDVRAIVRNSTGAQGLLEEGQVRLPRLGVGKSVRGAVGFSVSPKAIPGEDLQLELIVGDAKSRITAESSAELPILPLETTDSDIETSIRNSLIRKFSKSFIVVTPEIKIYAGAHQKSKVVGRLPKGHLVRTVAKKGDWFALQDVSKRRVWVSSQDLEPSRGKAKKIQLSWMVNPPRIEIQDNGVQNPSKKTKMRLTGLVKDDGVVRDVMIGVRGSGPHTRERKLFYRANPSTEKDESAAGMPFALDLALQPGNNHIRIIARDEQRIQAEHKLWLYREPQL